MVETMRNPYKKIILLLSILGIILLLWGCAGRKDQREAFNGKEYKKLTQLMKEKQRAATQEEDALNKKSDMTAQEYERLGDTYLRQGQREMAFLQYDRALRQDPNQPGIRYKQGRLFLEKGMTEEAGKEFQGILRLDPQYALAYEGMGWFFFKKNEMKGAEQNLLRAIQLDPLLWQAHHLLGVVYDRQRQFD